MKKLVSLLLVLTMALSLAACGNTNNAETTGPVETTTPVETTAPKVMLEGTVEELLNKIVTENPVEFMGGVMPVDIADTTEDGLAALKYMTGLDSAELITEAGVFEPMMGSIAFSMVMVRVADAANAQTVAEQIKNGIDTRKWICVEANETIACGYGDVVMFIMLDNQNGMTAQSFVDAFQTVCGAELDFTI